MDMIWRYRSTQGNWIAFPLTLQHHLHLTHAQRQPNSGKIIADNEEVTIVFDHTDAGAHYQQPFNTGTSQRPRCPMENERVIVEKIYNVYDERSTTDFLWRYQVEGDEGVVVFKAYPNDFQAIIMSAYKRSYPNSVYYPPCRQNAFFKAHNHHQCKVVVYGEEVVVVFDYNNGAHAQYSVNTNPQCNPDRPRAVVKWIKNVDTNRTHHQWRYQTDQDKWEAFPTAIQSTIQKRYEGYCHDSGKIEVDGKEYIIVFNYTDDNKVHHQYPITTNPHCDNTGPRAKVRWLKNVVVDDTDDNDNYDYMYQWRYRSGGKWRAYPDHMQATIHSKYRDYHVDSGLMNVDGKECKIMFDYSDDAVHYQWCADDETKFQRTSNNNSNNSTPIVQRIKNVDNNNNNNRFFWRQQVAGDRDHLVAYPRHIQHQLHVAYNHYNVNSGKFVLAGEEYLVVFDFSDGATHYEYASKTNALCNPYGSRDMVHRRTEVVVSDWVRFVNSDEKPSIITQLCAQNTLLLDGQLNSDHASENGFGNRELLGLVKCIRDNTCHLLHMINLSGNNLDDSSGERFWEAIANNTSIRFINVGDNRMGKKSGLALARALGKNTTLCDLNIKKNVVGDEAGVRIAEEVANNTKSSLHYLNVCSNNLGCNSGFAFASLVENNSSLETLNLGLNNLGVSGVALGKALAKNTTLHILKLYKSYLDDKAGVAFAMGLEKNDCLEYLDLDENDLDEESGVAMGAALEVNTCLRKLCVRCNNLGVKSGHAILKALSTNLRIEVLIHVNSSIPPALMVQIRFAMSPQLRALLQNPSDSPCRVPVCFVGFNNAGKSTLVHTFRRASKHDHDPSTDNEESTPTLGHYERSRTAGVAISEIKLIQHDVACEPRQKHRKVGFDSDVSTAPTQVSSSTVETEIAAYDFGGHDEFYIAHNQLLRVLRDPVFVIMFRLDSEHAETEMQETQLITWLKFIATTRVKQQNHPTCFIAATFRDKTFRTEAASALWTDSILQRVKARFNGVLNLPQDSIYHLDCRKSCDEQTVALKNALATAVESIRTQESRKVPRICEIVRQKLREEKTIMADRLRAYEVAKMHSRLTNAHAAPRPPRWDDTKCAPVMTRTHFESNFFGDLTISADRFEEEQRGFINDLNKCNTHPQDNIIPVFVPTAATLCSNNNNNDDDEDNNNNDDDNDNNDTSRGSNNTTTTTTNTNATTTTNTTTTNNNTTTTTTHTTITTTTNTTTTNNNHMDLTPQALDDVAIPTSAPTSATTSATLSTNVLKYLHDVGCILWFDTDTLRDTVVLCPHFFFSRFIGASFQPDRNGFPIPPIHNNGALVPKSEITAAFVAPLGIDAEHVDPALSLLCEMGLCYSYQGRDEREEEQFLFPATIASSAVRHEDWFGKVESGLHFVAARRFSLGLPDTTIFVPGCLSRIQSFVLNRYPNSHVWRDGVVIPYTSTGTLAEAGIQIHRSHHHRRAEQVLISNIILVVRGKDAACQDDCVRLLDELCHAVHSKAGGMVLEKALPPKQVAKLSANASECMLDYTGRGYVHGLPAEVTDDEDRPVSVGDRYCSLKCLRYGDFVWVSDPHHHIPRPEHWIGTDFEPVRNCNQGGANLLAVVKRGTQEFDRIQRKLCQSLPHAVITTIQRVQNRSLWTKYYLARSDIACECGGDANEIKAWHSTGKTNPWFICSDWKAGFDINRSIVTTRLVSDGVTEFLNVRNKVYGTGAYFAKNALYSDTLMPYKIGGGTKQIILAKVILGNVSDHGANIPSFKAAVEEHGCHSISGTEGDMKFLRRQKEELVAEGVWTTAHQRLIDQGSEYGKQFVVHRSNQTYPEYLVTYK